MAQHLAGKDAEFDVTVKEVAAPGELKIDDELAKGFGMESLDKLKDAVRGAIQRDFDTQARRKVKKDLLDALDGKYAFELPPSLVEQEFAAVWSQVESEMKNNGKTFADEGTTEDEARADYRKIAERRVRLGLVLAQIGEKSDIKVSDDEVTQLSSSGSASTPARSARLGSSIRRIRKLWLKSGPLFSKRRSWTTSCPRCRSLTSPSRRRRCSPTTRPMQSESKSKANAEGEKASKSE